MSDAADLWWLVIAAILATYLWRFLGTLFARRIDPQGTAFRWVTCVSYAMLAGLISRMVIMPAGDLVDVPLWIRLSGIAVGVLVFYLCGRAGILAVGAGLATFIGLVAHQ